jgi:hypothetical protein
MTKKYEWEGKPVSRSTFYRNTSKKPAAVLTSKSVAATRQRLKAEVDRVVPPLKASAVDWDRIESFVGMTEQHVNGDPNEAVSVVVPRKWLQSVRKVLPKVAA